MWGSLRGEVQATPHTGSGVGTGKDLVIGRTFLESQTALSPLPQPIELALVSGCQEITKEIFPGILRFSQIESI